MKPNLGDHELQNDEYADSSWVTRRGNKLFVIDSLFRGMIFETDKQVTEAVQQPASYFENSGIKGKIIENSVFQISFLMTQIFSVECAASVCYLLHLMTPLTSQQPIFVIYSYFTLQFISQLLKFLFWRNRPWRLDVGKVFIRDKTSSWPSRTVLQSIAFISTLMINDFDDTRGNNWGAILYWTSILAIIVSGSRIYIGAHFFSDCVCGALIAWIMTFINYYTFRGIKQICMSKYFHQMYHGLGYYHLLVLIVLFVLAHNYLFSRDINFWEKGSTIFGALSGIFLGRLEMQSTSVIHQHMEILNVRSLFIALVLIGKIAIINEILSKKIKSKQKFIPRLCAFVSFMILGRCLVMYNDEIMKR